jgi:hypothetical protein
MNIYEVIYKRTAEELAKKYETPRKKKYYDKDGKVCFKVNVLEQKYKVVVISPSEEQIKKVYGESCEYKVIGEEHNPFSVLIKDNVVVKKPPVKIKEKFIRQKDKPCSKDVQIKYQKDPEKWFNEVIETQEF